MKITLEKLKSIINKTMSLKQRVLKKDEKPCKLGKRTSGPYKVLQTHVNGTLTIELRPGASERLNMRRIIPYKEPTATKSQMCNL